MMSGGGRDLPNGLMSARLSRFSLGIDNRLFRQIWVITIFVLPKRVRSRQNLLESMVFTDLSIGIIGLKKEGGFLSVRLMKCWRQENLTSRLRWHGLMEGKTLIQQEYGGADDYIAHFNVVLRAFKDSRYITCEGKPVFFIYRPELHPDVERFISLWRKLAEENGLPGICFIAIASIDKSDSKLRDNYKRLKAAGFDMVNSCGFKKNLAVPLLIRLMRSLLTKKIRMMPNIWKYDDSIFSGAMDGQEDVIPCVYSGWDNTPRAGKNGLVLHGFSPERFQKALEIAVKGVLRKPFEKRFLTIKSWNEWAEGNFIEPDMRWGRRLLEAIKKVVKD